MVMRREVRTSRWSTSTGLQVECRAPLVERGKQKVVDQPRIITWLIESAQTRHEAQLAKNAAAVLLEVIGTEFGLLDQELAKLVLYAGPSGKISEKLRAGDRQRMACQDGLGGD